MPPQLQRREVWWENQAGSVLASCCVCGCGSGSGVADFLDQEKGRLTVGWNWQIEAY